MKQRIVKILLALILFSILLIFGGAWYFSGVLLHPKPHRCMKDHYIFCGDPKTDLGLDFENIEYVTSDGMKISAWWIPAPKKSDKVILSIHGRGATRREGLRYVKLFHDQGLNVILPDLRDCGESQKSFSSMGFHERKDLSATLEYAKQRGMKSFGILGFSMGSSTSILFMAENPEIKIGIFDSGFADFVDVITFNAKKDFGLPKYPLLPLVVFFYEWRGNLETDELSPEKVIDKISPRPVLIFHGDADTGVPYEHGLRLGESAKEPKEFVGISGGEHTKLWQKDQGLVSSKILKLIQKL
ncbi:alpha/beta hydrolase [Leptospira stimsonii]|uniref:Alpha/beta hydrolase n=1 Tax=Leptospira stimsonii TaxID=2202203 RepID=A0A396ZBH7_9LEPT|nr:prolyl oligopeptidase family serine peptidase [Leptospira stimsonii]RHX92962.1 alpha/beta hydrolase [Leptospira stimsonii]